MSRFLSERYSALVPYTPGEQPQNRKYVKLNTNESPFPPSPGVKDVVFSEAEKINLYSDPESKLIRHALAEHYGLQIEQLIVGNGSDEILNFAFMAFCDDNTPAIFPDISYGFYPVYADMNRLPYIEVPLNDDLDICIEDYKSLHGTVFLANPNAPTGRAKSASELEELLKARPDSILVVDEAYVDFGAESMLSLLPKYDNLLVIQTFSKFRSLAGARLGYAAGNPELIRDLNMLKYSTNPYNVNRMTSAAGIAALRENEYYRKNAQLIVENREYTESKLSSLGFHVLPSKSNFLFAQVPDHDGKGLYLKLKERGVLVRHFDKKRISDYVRITIGTREQMEILIREIQNILEVNDNEQKS